MSRSRTPQDSDADRIFHRREWRIQRIGWVLLALFLLLALAGLFGDGPLSHTRASNAAASIEYERFVRNGLSTEFVITPLHAVSRIAITADYFDAFRVEQITPQPTAVRISGRQLVFEFESTAPGAAISFHIHPQRLGRHAAQVTVDTSAPLAIRQLTYP
jgi:hypothetical protein